MIAPPIDTTAQFAKLCPHWLHCDLDKFGQLAIVRVQIEGEQQASRDNHWTRDANRLQALIELRDALIADINSEELELLS